MAKKFPDLPSQLNKSDYAAFAAALHKAGYYSQLESKYALSLKKQKEYLDKVLTSK